MVSSMRKKYINALRPYEAPYVKAMLLSGVGVNEATDKLNGVNSKTGAPFRSSATIRKIAPGARRQYQRENMRNIALAYETDTGTDVAEIYNVTDVYVRYCSRRYKKGDL